jgi:hypothetical protein
MQITIPFGDEPRIQLTSHDEITAWVDGELAFWARFQGAFGVNPLHHAFSWSTVENTLQQLKVVSGAGRPESDIQSAANNITGYVAFSSRHALAVFLARLIASGETLATAALIYTLYKQPDIFSQVAQQPNLFGDALKAAYHLTSFRQRQHEHAFPAFEAQFSTFHQETITALRRAQEEVRLAEQQRLEWSARANSEIERQASQSETELSRIKVELVELQRDYSEKFALRAPIEYWSKKATDHDSRASLYRNWFIGLLSVGCIVLGCVAILWLLPQLERRPNILWPVVLFSALVAMLAWPVRLASKFYLSQRHLFEDSKEREIIAQTFLALREKVDMKDDDRKLLLAALFRDSTAGLVKDDHSVNLIDVLTSSLRGKP